MRTFLFFTFLLFTVLGTFAQRTEGTYYYGYEKIDPKSVNKYDLQDKIDSLRHVSLIDSLEGLLYYITRDSIRYTSFDLGSEISFADFSDLNKDLESIGLSPVNEVFASFSEGISVRTKRLLNTFYLNFIFANKTSNDSIKASISGGNFFNWNIGYDLINARNIQFYPMVGLYHQYFNLKLNNELIDESKIDNINTLVAQYENSYFIKNDFGYSLGFELDYMLHRADYGGVIFGSKYSILNDFTSNNFKLLTNKTKYGSSFSLRSSAVHFFVKIFIWNRTD